MEQFGELVEYYKGLIALRKMLPGLYDKSEKASQRISGQTIHREGMVSFFVDNRSGKQSDEWEALFIIYNASDAFGSLELPGGDWEILVDKQAANCRKKVEGRFAVPPCSGMVLGKRN